MANKYIEEFNGNLKEKQKNKNANQIEQTSPKNKLPYIVYSNKIIIADPQKKF